MDSKGLLVQELEGTIFALANLILGSILVTVINAVDIIGRSGDLLEPFGRVVTWKRLVATFAVDMEGEIFDHVRFEWNVGQGWLRWSLLFNHRLLLHYLYHLLLA